MGGKGGGGSPYQSELAQLALGALGSRFAQTDPNAARILGADTDLGKAFREVTGGNVPAYQAAPSVQAFGPQYNATAARLASAGGSQPFRFQTPQPVRTNVDNVPINTPQLNPTQSVSMDPSYFRSLNNQGMENIAQGARSGQNSIMRQLAARGVGQSGIAGRTIANNLNQNVNNQIGSFQQGLAGKLAEMNFGEAQKARDLEAQRQLNQGNFAMTAQQLALDNAYRRAGLSSDEARFNATQGMQTQAAQAGEYNTRRAQDASNALGLGQLGVGERAQNLAELKNTQAYGDFITPLIGALGQTSVGSSQGGKK